ncbi:uncharacterized protein LOC133300739 [Gastrolobium bilobum]|uniref:uncharacterized protein LOC133300739 n=1 Tax=Gastrolobium bilobum TaxID=150636 RepID=UPI002AB0E929|nr:uncharacterized protein LOC133300739 [Gastrolobium bilobum]
MFDRSYSFDWAGFNTSLFSLAIIPPTAETADLKLNRSIFSSDQGWNVHFLINHFDGSVVNQIMAIPHLMGKQERILFAGKIDYQNIILESDSVQAIGLLTTIGNHTRKLPLVTKIRAALNKDWSVCLKHISRTCNYCADWIAKKAMDDPFAFTTISSPHSELINLLAADMLDPGSIMPAARCC